jgi:hypothetical protein
MEFRPPVPRFCEDTPCVDDIPSAFQGAKVLRTSLRAEFVGGPLRTDDLL